MGKKEAQTNAKDRKLGRLPSLDLQNKKKFDRNEIEKD